MRIDPVLLDGVQSPLTWEQAFAAGPERCGGKGFNLGRLARFGFRVPRGGVLPAQWYAEFLKFAPERAMRFLSAVGAEDVTSAEVLAALEEVRSALESAELSPAFEEALAEFLDDQGLASVWIAVRSSATAEDSARASFAGIHTSFLNRRGLDDISRAIRGCYASLWTPQALAYRRRMKFDDDEVRCAVVLCEMVHAPGSREPQAAGVAFTFDPLSGRRDLIVIDAATGSGESVVGGLGDPQRIVYRNVKGTLHLESRRGGTALLPPERERELAHQLYRLHWAFGDGQDPQDVEWAYDGRDLWLVQARPATNVRRAMPAPVAALPRYWSTANIKDAVPGVICTLSWSLLKDGVDAIAFAPVSAAGYDLPLGTELIRRFRGHAYFELTLLQWVLYDSMGLLPEQVVQSIGGHQPQIPVPGDPTKGPEGRRRARAVLRFLFHLWGLERKLRSVVESRTQFRRDFRNRDLPSLSADEIKAMFNRLTFDSDSMDLLVGLANSAEGPWEMALLTFLKPIFGDNSRALLSRLLAGMGDVTSAEHGYAIYRLAAAARGDQAAREWLRSGAPATDWVKLPEASSFRAELAGFLEEFGHRGVYEADYLNPRWEEDPTYILEQVRFALAHPQAADPRAAARRLREEAGQVVRSSTGWRAPIIFWMVRKLQRTLAVREFAKSHSMAAAQPCKKLALEIGRRLVQAGFLAQAGDALHLSWADLLCWLEGWWDGSGAGALAATRAAQREAWLAEEAPPDVIAEEPDGRTAPQTIVSARHGEQWRGIGAAPGRASGKVRIVLHPNQAWDFQAGEILVAPSTDPGWTPLFLRAAAIVMASGGYLSHGAIVAREYGIPAVVNVPGILTDLKSGDRIVVDGDSGTVIREGR